MEQKNEPINSHTSVETKKGNNVLKFFNFIKGFIILFLFTSVIEVVILRFLPPSITPLMIIRAGEKLFTLKSPGYQYQWRPFDKISDNMKLAVISSEDQNFIKHFGIDFKEIQRAYEASKKKSKKRLRGASTISQQVAKNVFLIPHRSFIRKGLELYYTLLIEIFWGKKKILETYLNVVEMGDGIYGIEAASKKYFRKDCSELSKKEVSAIAAVLPNPKKYSVTNPSSYILKRRSWIRRQMNNLGKEYLKKL